MSTRFYCPKLSISELGPSHTQGADYFVMQYGASLPHHLQHKAENGDFRPLVSLNRTYFYQKYRDRLNSYTIGQLMI
jgi:hypothetical protein